MGQSDQMSWLEVILLVLIVAILTITGLVALGRQE
jgi:hypothetical protein